MEFIKRQFCTDCGEIMKPSETTFTVGYHSIDDEEIQISVNTHVCSGCKLEWIEGNSRKIRNRDQ